MDDKKKLNLLLCVLGLFVVGYLLYTFLFSPLFKDIAAADSELETQKMNLATYNSKVTALEKTAGRILENVVSLKDRTEAYLPDLDHDKVLNVVRTVSAELGISDPDVYFYDMSVSMGLAGIVTTVDPSTGDSLPPPKKMNDSESRADVLNKMTQPYYSYIMPVSFRFKGITFEQAIDFMKAIEGYDRTIYFNSFSIEESTSEEGVLDVSLDYNFYAVDKMTLDDKGFDEVPDADSVGKTNPFE